MKLSGLAGQRWVEVRSSEQETRPSLTSHEPRVKILEEIYKESSASIKIPIQKGIRQGDIISLKIFTVVLGKLLNTLNGKRQEFRKMGNMKIISDFLIVLF